MNYYDYYLTCLKETQPLDLRKFTFQVLPFKLPIDGVHETVFDAKKMQAIQAEDWIKKVAWENRFLDLLKPALDQLVPYLEDLYKTYIFFDKIYIYRSVPFDRRTTSAIWHYDNTPPTQLKTILYLEDVNDLSDGPIEFCKNLVKEPTRQGPAHWYAPANGSRLSEEEVANEEKAAIYGEAGTATLFYPSCVHRANPPATGKVRDVINFLTQPTSNRTDLYKYISGFEKPGSPLMDPRQRRSL